MVAIEIFSEEEWRKPSDIVLEDKADDPGDLLEEETVLLKNSKPDKKTDDEITPTGKVVGVIRRKWRQYCGILMPSKFPGKWFLSTSTKQFFFCHNNVSCIVLIKVI